MLLTDHMASIHASAVLTQCIQMVESTVKLVVFILCEIYECIRKIYMQRDFYSCYQSSYTELQPIATATAYVQLTLVRAPVQPTANPCGYNL